MKSKVTITIIICIIFIAALAVASWFVLSRDNNANNGADSINSFEACAAAGNPIQETFPEVCVTPDGQRFVNTVQEVQ